MKKTSECKHLSEADGKKNQKKHSITKIYIETGDGKSSHQETT